MKKTKKALASLAIAGMVLSMAPMSVFGATTTPTRIAGADRVATAIAVAAQGWTTSDNVIVVSADDANIVDALAAAPLAGQLNAPILVTYKGALDASVQQKIVDLKAKNVYAVGALSADAVNSLKAISGVTVTALQGADRTETAAKVAAQLTNIKGSFVVAYNGVADALSAASFAAANGYSVVVANPDGTVPANEAGYVKTPTYTVGGQVKLDGATALAGADRYATNEAVVKGLTYKNDTVYVANGQSLVDALAGAPLAAKTNSPIVLADSVGIANVVANGAVVALGGVGAVSDAVLGQVGKTNTGVVSVSSVSAASANSFKVVFTSAPADTSKVNFTVQRDTTPVTVTATWNEAKTEATVASSSNFPEGTYSVAVKNDTTDLGTSSVTVSEQKIAKINITSTTLAVTNPTTGSGIGYATYSVEDQYGNDITDSSLAGSLEFQSGVGSVDIPNKGILKVTPNGVNLIQFGQVVITGYDSTSGVSTSATLAVSTALGTLSDIKLSTLTNVDNKVLTGGDLSSVWYIDYTALDVSGNATKDLNMVEGGLILNDSKGLSVSSNYVTATVESDPSDSAKAAIRVQVKGGADLAMDIPVTITAMTYTGKQSSISVTLKKPASVDSFKLMAPSFDIARNEVKQLPFTANDQNGAAITKYSDLALGTNKVSLSGGAYWDQNVDGTAKLMVKANDAKGPQIITASTTTGKFSTLTLNIREYAVAESLAVDTSVLVAAMQMGATQGIDFGSSYGGLAVKDQYGRTVDMSGAPGSYRVTATAVANTTAGAISIDPAKTTAYKGNAIVINAGNVVGTGSVRFDLINTADSNKVLDTKTVTLSVLENKDIKGYVIDTVDSPIYAGTPSTTTGAAITGRQNSYAANPNVYGTTSAGSKVMLKSGSVVGAFVSNATDFAVDTKQGSTDYDGVYVAAKELPTSKTEASTTLTVTVMGADGNIHTLSTPIKSSTTAPVASSLVASVSTTVDGISVNAAGDVVTVDTTNATAMSKFASGMFLARYDASGEYKVAGVSKRAGVHFYAKDQYGSKGMALATIMTVASEGGSFTYDGNAYTDLGSNFVVANDGTITTSTLSAGKTVKLTAVTTNGLAKTIQVIFK